MHALERHARGLFLGMIALLAVCFAQAAYWVVDQVHYTAEVRARIAAVLEEEYHAARRLLAGGMPEVEVRLLFPRLAEIAGPEGDLLSTDYLARLDAERRRRLRQYGAEGAFFLLVLLAAMGLLAQALKQSSELLRRQQNFIAAVSHEFKSPLANLKLSTDALLLREMDRDSIVRIADRMAQGVDRLEALVTNILNVASIEEGRSQPVPEPLDVGERTRQVVSKTACRAHVQGVEVVVSVPDGLVVVADPIAFDTVLTNLVRNAIQAVRAAGGGKVAVHARREDRWVRLEVRDEGIGFARGEARRLFGKFYRPGDELMRKTKGTGLGLYIVRHLVESHGGRVRAASDGPGRGAVFTVDWPAARGSEQT